MDRGIFLKPLPPHAEVDTDANIENAIHDSQDSHPKGSTIVSVSGDGKQHDPIFNSINNTPEKGMNVAVVAVRGELCSSNYVDLKKHHSDSFEIVYIDDIYESVKSDVVSEKKKTMF